jgi:hypothetical protein
LDNPIVYNELKKEGNEKLLEFDEIYNYDSSMMTMFKEFV